MMISVLNQVMEVPDIEHRILRVIRKERKDPEWPNSSKRPLKVKCNDTDAKFKFLKKAYKLKESDDELMKEKRIIKMIELHRSQKSIVKGRVGD